MYSGNHVCGFYGDTPPDTGFEICSICQCEVFVFDMKDGKCPECFADENYNAEQLNPN